MSAKRNPYPLTGWLCERLEACAEAGESHRAGRCDNAPDDYPELMRESVAKLREVEDRLETMWQLYRWTGD